MKRHPESTAGAALRVGIVVSRFNSAVTERLLTGATEALLAHGVAADAIEIVRVPGAFEIPLAARAFAQSGRVDAIVCLGAVVRGETPHFEYISASCVNEIGGLAVRHGIPMSLGILTTDTIEQALARAGGGHGNKGAEAAVTAIEMANLCRALSAKN